MDGNIAAVRLPEKNGKETHRWGVAEIQKMSPPTTGRCSTHTADQWERGTATGQPITTLLNFWCGRPDPYSFFLVDQMGSKFPSHSSLVSLLSFAIPTEVGASCPCSTHIECSMFMFNSGNAGRDEMLGHGKTQELWWCW